MVETDQYVTSKDLYNEKNEITLLRNQLESNEIKLAIAESSLSKVKVREVKLIKEAMREKGNKVLDIIRNFHFELNINFLEAREEDVKDTLTPEDSTLPMRL